MWRANARGPIFPLHRAVAGSILARTVHRLTLPFWESSRRTPMATLQDLSAVALRQLVSGACNAIGSNLGGEAAERVIDFLAERFTDHSQRLTKALLGANERAWKAFEVALGLKEAYGPGPSGYNPKKDIYRPRPRPMQIGFREVGIVAWAWWGSFLGSEPMRIEASRPRLRWFVLRSDTSRGAAPRLHNRTGTHALHCSRRNTNCRPALHDLAGQQQPHSAETA